MRASLASWPDGGPSHPATIRNDVVNTVLKNFNAKSICFKPFVPSKEKIQRQE